MQATSSAPPIARQGRLLPEQPPDDTWLASVARTLERLVGEGRKVRHEYPDFVAIDDGPRCSVYALPALYPPPPGTGPPHDT